MKTSIQAAKNHLRRLVKRYFVSGHDLRGLVKPIKIFPHMNRFDMDTNPDHPTWV